MTSLQMYTRNDHAEASLIRISPLDNVAIVVNDGGLPSSTYIEEYQLTLVDEVPQGHKVLLEPLKQGEAIVRYGEIIGYVNKDLPAGSWVNEAVTKCQRHLS